jgi:Na+/H+ antiporter NhaC
MIAYMFMAIIIGRDAGAMLVAERKARVYEITDGGDGKGREAEEGGKERNEPEDDTPCLAYNMILPVLLLIFFIFWLLVQTGTIPGESQTFMEKIENSDSYAALLWGTMGAVLCTTLMYLLQIVQDGRLVRPTVIILKNLFFFWRKKAQDEDAPPMPRFLMSVYQSVEGFLFGMGRIFPALIVLTLAWASGELMGAVGVDRLFSSWIVNGIPAQLLPTMSFVISLLMALATGTSWGT